MKKLILTLLILTFTKEITFSQCATSTDGQNLIVNGDFSAGNSAFTSGYTQHCLSCVSGSGGCNNRDAYQIGYSNAGEYCVTSDVYQNFHCCLPNFSGSITHTFTDHSPSADNMAMLVDGNSSLGVDLWCQTVTVQSFTNYYFTAYIGTLFYDGDANKLGKIRFKINGASVGTTIISPTTLGAWTAYTYVWASNATSGPISICITNDNTNSDGNDFILDDIAFTAGCAFGASGPQPSINGGAASVTLCGNPGGVVLSSGSGGVVPEYIWKKDGVIIPGATSANYNATAAGVYEVCTRETSPPSCYRSDVITVTSNYSVNLGTDATLCNPPSVTLNAGITGSGISYVWKRNGSVIAGATSATYLAASAGTYVVEVTDPICGFRTDEIILSSSLTSTPNNNTFCAPPAANVNLSVTGSGIFNWYDSPSGGSILAGGSNTNNFTTPLISATTTYYVADATLTSYNVGPDRGDIGGGIGSNEDRRDNLYGSGGTGDFFLEFQTFKPNIVINSVVMYGYCNQWTPCAGNLRLSFYNTSNVLQYQSALYPYSLTGGMGGSPITMLTVPVNVTLAAAGTYRVSIDGSTTGNSAQWILKTNMAPVSCNYTAFNIPGTFSFSVSRPSWMTCPWTYFFKWNISAPGDCGRVPVQAIMDCTLPVEFLDFDVRKTNGNAMLGFVTVENSSTDYYEVQRSEDGINFTTIAMLNAQSGGAGTVMEYKYTDHLPGYGIIYYRIVQYDKDGSYYFSDIRHISIESLNVEVVPNPTDGKFDVYVNTSVAEGAVLKLTDALGQTVRDVKAAASLVRFDLSDVTPGVYYLKVITSSESHTKKILVE